MEATDFATGNWVEATHAVYVSDSDVHPCATLEARRDPQGCCMAKTYDRCLPSLVAFATKDQAAVFQKDHGGQLVGFEAISAK
jgi:nitrous oxide reductase accessory protein NosL